MQSWNILLDWNSLDAVRRTHNYLEGGALLFFALLVLFDVLAHLSEDQDHQRAKLLERIALWCFGLAVLAEIAAFPYSHRNDTLSGQQDSDQKAQIAKLENSTQRLKTDAENAKVRSGELERGLEEERQKTARFQKEADVARLALERQLKTQGPRWALLEERKTTFIEDLKPFAGQPVTVVECGAWGSVAPESFRLEQDLLSLLGKEGAGWAMGYRSWARCPAGGATSNGGNGVIVNSTASAGVMNAAKALHGTLNKLAISTIMHQLPTNLSDALVAVFGAGSPEDLARKDATQIFLLIGPNPMYDLEPKAK